MRGLLRRIAWGCTRTVGIVATLALSAAAMPAVAQAADASMSTDKRTQARAKLIEGDGLLKAGEFQAALSAFKEAYDLYPSPKIHYNLGLAYQGMGRNADAIDAIDAFLAITAELQPDVLERARSMRGALKDRVGTLVVKADPSNRGVIVDGRDLEKTNGDGARDREIFLDPGPHLLLIERSSGAPPFTHRFDLQAKAVVTVVVPVEATIVATAPAPSSLPQSRSTDAMVTASTPSAGRSWRTAGIATAAGGVVLVGTGLAFGLAARSAANAVSSTYDAQRDSAGKRDAALAWIGYGVGAAAIAAGAVLFHHGFQQETAANTESQRAFHVVVGPTAIAAAGTF